MVHQLTLVLNCLRGDLASMFLGMSRIVTKYIYAGAISRYFVAPIIITDMNEAARPSYWRENVSPLTDQDEFFQ